MVEIISLQIPQRVSETELLPSINPEHEAFFLQFVPGKYYDSCGHRDLKLASIHLDANRGETVAIYEINVPSPWENDDRIHSYEFRIRSGKLIENDLGARLMNRQKYLASRAAPPTKSSRK